MKQAPTPHNEPTTETEEPAEGVEELDLLELVAAAQEERTRRDAARPARVEGVVVGHVVAVAGAQARVLHRYAASEQGDLARCMVAVADADVGREVALLFEGGSPDAPIVMGFMHAGAPASRAPRAEDAEAEADGARLVFQADKEIVLRCGAASITLTRAGKILIRGAYVSSRASNVNRIQGGSVEIN